MQLARTQSQTCMVSSTAVFVALSRAVVMLQMKSGKSMLLVF